MNILFVNDLISVEGGGIAAMIRELAPPLSRLGHRCFILCGEQDPTIPEGIMACYSSPSVNRDSLVNTHTRKFIKEIINQNNIDVIHINNINNIEVIKTLTSLAPSVFHIHNYSYWCPGNDLFHSKTNTNCTLTVGLHCYSKAYTHKCNNRHPKRLFSSIRRTHDRKKIQPRFLRTIVSSQYLYARACEAGIPPEQISIVPYAVNTDRFIATANTINTDSTSHILYVGRLAKSKGIDYLLDAYENLPDNKPDLVIVGDGYYRPHLEHRARLSKTKDRIHFVGWKSDNELAQLYRDCNMLVVPSIWQEVFGIIGLEAMATAKPVVAFDVGGISQWLEHNITGLLVPPKSVWDLRDAIKFLLDHPHIAGAMGSTGRSVAVNKYSTDIVCNLLLETYKILLNSPDTPTEISQNPHYQEA